MTLSQIDDVQIVFRFFIQSVFFRFFSQSDFIIALSIRDKQFTQDNIKKEIKVLIENL